MENSGSNSGSRVRRRSTRRKEGGNAEGDRRVSCSVRVSDKRIGNAFISPFIV